MATIEELIYRHTLHTPDKTALQQGDLSISYGELWSRIVGVASYFKKNLVLKTGDRVIISANKQVEFIYAYFGAHLCGLICVPIDPETNPVRLNRIVECSAPSLIIGELRNQPDYDILPFDTLSECFATENEAPVSFPCMTDMADLLFTTGTTGLPKGVSLTFGNLSAAVDNINTFIGNTSADTELLALPVSHSFGLGRLRCVLSKGGILVLLGSFASMKKFFGELEKYHVTGFGMVPASWGYLLKMSGEKIGKYAGQLKYIEIGSAFMPLENKQKLMSLLPHTRICMHYGLTEASRSTFISFHDESEHIDSIGKASPNTEIVILDEQENLSGSNQEGELCVKGSHVCSGYWGTGEEQFREDFYGNYFKTGDWGYMDEDGYIYLRSRKKEMINVGGKKVSPLEVEEALNTLEGISESACISVSDNVMGEVVKAFIVCETGCVDEEQIKRSLSGMLENYKIPANIQQINEIPKTSSGKVQRLLLREYDRNR